MRHSVSPTIASEMRDTSASITRVFLTSDATGRAVRRPQARPSRHASNVNAVASAAAETPDSRSRKSDAGPSFHGHGQQAGLRPKNRSRDRQSPAANQRIDGVTTLIQTDTPSKTIFWRLNAHRDRSCGDAVRGFAGGRLTEVKAWPSDPKRPPT